MSIHTAKPCVQTKICLHTTCRYTCRCVSCCYSTCQIQPTYKVWTAHIIPFQTRRGAPIVTCYKNPTGCVIDKLGRLSHSWWHGQLCVTKRNQASKIATFTYPLSYWPSIVTMTLSFIFFKIKRYNVLVGIFGSRYRHTIWRGSVVIRLFWRCTVRGVTPKWAPPQEPVCGIFWQFLHSRQL